MNDNGLAYSTLQMLLEDWANDHPDLVRYPDLFAIHVADRAFYDYLGIDHRSIDNEG